MKATFLAALLVALSPMAAVPLAASTTIVWGGSAFTTNVDTDGNPIDGTFSIALGSFGSFVPNYENALDWQGNFKLFDKADYNASTGFFSSSAELSVAPSDPDPESPTLGVSNSTDIAGASSLFNPGERAYVWVYNSMSPSLTAQWALLTAADWTMPILVSDCCGNAPPVYWNLQDVARQGDVIAGRVRSFVGEGTIRTDTPTAQIQVAVVPEPSLFAIGAAAAALLFVARSARRTNRQVLGSTAIALALLATLGGRDARAASATVLFSCPAGAGQIGADGAALREGFFYELGAFTPGFTPTPANVEQWRANWTPLARARYNPEKSFFFGQVQLTANAAPFTTSNRGWLWGRDAYNADEWVLVGAANWRWPAVSSPASPTPPHWSLSAAGAAAVWGSVAIDAAGAVVRTARVSAPAPQLTVEQWRSTIFAGESNAAATAPDGDFDGDNVPNSLEFAFGSNARDASDAATPTAFVWTDGSDSFLALRVRRNPAAAAVVTVEGSRDLQTWDKLVSNGALKSLSDTSTSLEVRAGEAATSDSPVFLRANVQ